MDDTLEILLEQICQDRGLDLGSYKESFLRRRLGIRMRSRGCLDYKAYGRLLHEDPEEYGPLLEALSINLTRFFRDTSTFQALEETILPVLFQAHTRDRRLSIWSAGCSAGEEPYSLAILLREMLGANLPKWRIKILATDVDAKALSQARTGVYEEFSFRELAPRYREWVQVYFTGTSEYQLSNEVRSMVTFERHNLLHDAPPTDLDLILCRNVLIYFGRELQERLYQAFHQALRKGGFLVLGKTEVLPMSWSRHFPVVNVREHIYRRVDPKRVSQGSRSRRQDEGKRVR
jgi:chemotaxis methyl-accepting protein methylase